MLILLPPSETKRPGGRRRPLTIDALRFPELTAPREAVVEAVVALSADPAEAARVLRLSPRQLSEIDDNARMRSAPTLPAVDRYTGVLYDALGADTLDAAARRWLGSHVGIQSAPFGLVGALDALPPYRLAAGTSLPGLPALRRVWADAVAAAIENAAPSFVLDLRSEAYAALGPVPPTIDSAYVRVVSDGADGVSRALNHFNKHAKGELVRRLALSRPRVASLAALRRWAASTGVSMRDGAPGEIDLVV
jgi:cytoplasmic iron level regulating protein YaaA (DUF328/UPF0246 family)